MLADFYNTVNDAEKIFEVILVSLDRDVDDYEASFPKGSPWVAIPFGKDGIRNLNKAYPCSGIPTLYVIKLDGYIVSGEGDGDIKAEGVSCMERWLNM